MLDQLHESRSSRASSKMYDKEEIKMVDSWVVVEKKQGSDSSHNPFGHKGKNFVLEESIILRAPKKWITLATNDINHPYNFKNAIIYINRWYDDIKQ